MVISSFKTQTKIIKVIINDQKIKIISIIQVQVQARVQVQEKLKMYFAIEVNQLIF